MVRTIKEFPSAEVFKESSYELDFIRTKLSGLFDVNDMQMNQSTLALLDLILCLANEIADLKEEVKILKLKRNDRRGII